VALTQDTPARYELLPIGVESDQPVPFQVSTMASLCPVLESCAQPVATQKVALAQDAPVRVAVCTPLSCGVVAGSHLKPSQVSMSGRLGEPLGAASPAATHHAVPAQDTPLKPAVCALTTGSR